MQDAKRRNRTQPAPTRAGDVVVAPDVPFTIDLGEWRLAVRVAAPAPRAADASFWSGPGLYARRIARRH